MKSLIPLYSGGLCEAVSIIPVPNPISLVSKAKAGVGRIPKSATSIPVERRPEVTASLIDSRLCLVSVVRETLDWEARLVPRALPISWHKSIKRSSATMPLIPLVPKRRLFSLHGSFIEVVAVNALNYCKESVNKKSIGGKWFCL